MKELDIVEVITDKKSYANDGVHKGMQGWICDERVIDGYRLVNFPQCGANADIATTEIKEEDLRIIPRLDARKNEEIYAQFYGDAQQ